MTKNPISRKRTRLLVNPSVADKQFAKLRVTKKSSQLPRDHAATVVLDLRNGSLESLSAYLAKNQSVPDPDVALELLKLICGTIEHCSYRLAIVAHPDSNHNHGGRPKNTGPLATDRDFEIAKRYDDLKQSRRATGGQWKVEAVTADIATELDVSPDAVRTARKRIRDHIRNLQVQEALNARIDNALETVRRK